METSVNNELEVTSASEVIAMPTEAPTTEEKLATAEETIRSQQNHLECLANALTHFLRGTSDDGQYLNQGVIIRHYGESMVVYRDSENNTITLKSATSDFAPGSVLYLATTVQPEVTTEPVDAEPLEAQDDTE